MLLKKPLYLIPLNSKKELNKKVSEFYEKDKDKIMEEYVQDISTTNKIRINLRWDERGLANISTHSGGFDLDDYGRRFRFHNINENSNLGELLITIAEKYISLLIKDK